MTFGDLLVQKQPIYLFLNPLIYLLLLLNAIYTNSCKRTRENNFNASLWSTFQQKQFLYAWFLYFDFMVRNLYSNYTLQVDV